jgi:hypothetical protein
MAEQAPGPRLLDRQLSTLPPFSWGPGPFTAYVLACIAVTIAQDEAITAPGWAHQLITLAICVIPVAVITAIRRRRPGKGPAA